MGCRYLGAEYKGDRGQVVPGLPVSVVMARLACRCLNINVFVTSSDWKSNPVPTSKLFSDLCPVKEDVAYEVNLDVGGVIVVSEGTSEYL